MIERQIPLEEALDAYLDYEAYSNGLTEHMDEVQGMRFEQMREADPDLPFFVEVRRRRLEREADMRFYIGWYLEEKLEELIPVSRTDVEREERELDARVRRLDFADYKRQRDAAIEALHTDRSTYIAQKMQGLGIFLPVIPADERADMIKRYAHEWHNKIDTFTDKKEMATQ